MTKRCDKDCTGDAPLPEALAGHKIIPGIKVDTGTMALPAFAGEKITSGLDGLRERLGAYRELGARFTKWRAVIAIGDQLPTAGAIAANAHALALFAALSQEAGLVPIVEPEVLMDGAHSLERCEEVTGATLRTVFATLIAQRVGLRKQCCSRRAWCCRARIVRSKPGWKRWA